VLQEEEACMWQTKYRQLRRRFYERTPGAHFFYIIVVSAGVVF
jgi:hypothetical protein